MYTLNDDGTTPNYIINGGHLAHANQKAFPQHLDLVGSATDEALEVAFLDELSLLNYAISIESTFYALSPDLETISIEEGVTKLWTEIQ